MSSVTFNRATGSTSDARAPGDVRSQRPRRRRDCSESPLRERRSGEADRVVGRLRRRQRTTGRLLCRHRVVPPARTTGSDLAVENRQQRYVHVRRVLHLAPGRGVGCQMRRNRQTSDSFHHLHRSRPTRYRLHHLDARHSDRWRK